MRNFKIASAKKKISQKTTCLTHGNKNTAGISETSIETIKNASDDEISPQDRKMFDLIQKGAVTRIYWDCVAKEGAEDEYGEEADE